jgi:hypothetical protein
MELIDAPLFAFLEKAKDKNQKNAHTANANHR